jgi:hypothetical protein
MKNTKHQTPSSRKTSNFKHQTSQPHGLELEVWSFSGAWYLVFGA